MLCRLSYGLRMRSWSGRRATIPQPPGWKPGALPVELHPRLARRGGVEPPPLDLETTVLPLHQRRVRLALRDGQAGWNRTSFPPVPDRECTHMHLRLFQTQKYVYVHHPRSVVRLAGIEPASPCFPSRNAPVCTSACLASLGRWSGAWESNPDPLASKASMLPHAPAPVVALGGERGTRTPGPREGTYALATRCIRRSAISPSHSCRKKAGVPAEREETLRRRISRILS